MAAQSAPLATLMMDGRPLPPPYPPVTDPTPQQQWERSQEQTRERATSLSRAAGEQQREAASKDTGFFGKVGAFAKATGHQMQEAATKAHAGTEAQLRQKVADRNQASFCEKFPEIVASSTPPQQCITSFACTALNRGLQVTGEIYLSATHVCFWAQGIKDAIPLTAIGSVQPSVVLSTSASGCGFQNGCKEDGPPFILPTPAPQVVPTCVQIFTTDGRIVQFLKFDNKATAAAATFSDSVTGNAFGRFYNDLDHAWRAAGPVPVPGVQYAQ